MNGPRDFLAIVADNIGPAVALLVIWLLLVICVVAFIGRGSYRRADEP